MKSKFNKKLFSGLTLVEVLVTMAVITGGIVLVYHSFSACLNASAFSQRLSRACFLAEDKLWEIGQYQKQKNDFSVSGAENIDHQEFKWLVTGAAVGGFNKITNYNLKISWKENPRDEYTLNFSEYLLTLNNDEKNIN